jgi:hypothetical protein
MDKIEERRDLYWQMCDSMRDDIKQDYQTVELEDGKTTTAIVCYSHNGVERHIISLGDKWGIVENKKVIAEIDPVDAIAISCVGEVIPMFNERLQLYEKIKASVK